MSGRVPYTKEQQQWLIANAQLRSVQSMADELGRTEKSVRSFFNKRGIPTRKDLYSAEEIKFIEENAGKLSWLEIAEKLGKSHDAIKTWASRKGISGSLAHRKVSDKFGPRDCQGLLCSRSFIANRANHSFCSISCQSSVHQLKKYGISLEEWNSIFSRQNGTCVCGKEISRGFAIDHDHSCCSANNSCGKCVRGILCQPCNLSVGLLKDSPDILRSLADYLSRYTNPSA